MSESQSLERTFGVGSRSDVNRQIEVAVLTALHAHKGIDAPSTVDPNWHTRVIEGAENLVHVCDRHHCLRESMASATSGLLTARFVGELGQAPARKSV
jgi:hypothetical protein